MTDLPALLRTAEFDLGGFLFPWGMIVGTLGFLMAMLMILFLERLRWTRWVWHLPVFFIALAILVGCALGLLLAP